MNYNGNMVNYFSLFSIGNWPKQTEEHDHIFLSDFPRINLDMRGSQSSQVELQNYDISYVGSLSTHLAVTHDYNATCFSAD